MKEYDVVVCNENHKWCGCIGYVKEIKTNKIMVGVPVPQLGVADIYCTGDDVERIGEYPFEEEE